MAKQTSKKKRGTEVIEFNCTCGKEIILRMFTDDGKHIKRTCTLINNSYMPSIREEPQVVEVEYADVEDMDCFYCDYCGTEHNIFWLDSEAR